MSETTTLVGLDGLRFRDDFADKEPRIRDLELAKRLGYAKSYDIRKLILRLHGEGNLPGICQFSTVANREDGMPSRPSQEYWLDEASALFVVARSETAKAAEMLRGIIAVFMAYRRGKLVPRLLADEMCEWSLMFPASLCAALCHRYGQPWDGKRQPRFLASVYPRLYKLVLEPHVYADMKARTSDPSWGNNLHQWLSEQARQRFSMHLTMIEQAAVLAVSVEDFWERLENFYLSRPLQLPLMGIPRLPSEHAP